MLGTARIFHNTRFLYAFVFRFFFFFVISIRYFEMIVNDKNVKNTHICLVDRKSKILNFILTHFWHESVFRLKTDCVLLLLWCCFFCGRNCFYDILLAYPYSIEFGRFTMELGFVESIKFFIRMSYKKKINHLLR